MNDGLHGGKNFKLKKCARAKNCFALQIVMAVLAKLEIKLPPLTASFRAYAKIKQFILQIPHFDVSHLIMRDRKICSIWWPRDLNVLQLQKTHINRKKICKLRNQLCQFDSRCCKCSQHNQIKNCISKNFFFGCVVSIFRAFILFGCVVSILWCVLSNWQSFCLN